MTARFKLPHSSSNCIIVALNKKSFLFDKNAYKEEYLMGFLQKEDFDKIIKKSNIITEDCWKNKIMVDDINIHPIADYLMIISMLLALLYTVFTFVSSFSKDVTVFAIAFLFVIIGSVIICGLALYNFFRKPPEFLVLSEVFQEKLDAYFAELNNKFTSTLDFRFYRKKWYFEIIIKKNIKIRSVLSSKEKKKDETEEEKEDKEIEMKKMK